MKLGEVVSQLPGCANVPAEMRRQALSFFTFSPHFYVSVFAAMLVVEQNKFCGCSCVKGAGSKAEISPVLESQRRYLEAGSD